MHDDIKSLTLDYFRKWIGRCRSPSDPLKTKILNANLGLVSLCAGKVSKRTSEPYADLYNEGVIGLATAIDKYDPAQGVFSSYAVKFIQGQMIRYLRDKAGPLVRTPRREYDTVSKINKLARERGTSPLAAAIASGYSAEEWQRMVLSTQRASVGALDNVDAIADQADDDDLQQQLTRAIDKYCLMLGDDGKVLKLHYHPDYGLPIAAIAKRMKIKPSEVKECLSRGINQIKESIAS